MKNQIGICLVLLQVRLLAILCRGKLCIGYLFEEFQMKTTAESFRNSSVATIAPLLRINERMRDSVSTSIQMKKV
jgi:hypothetical protein